MAKNHIDEDAIKAFAVRIVSEPSQTLDNRLREVIYSYNREEATELLKTILNFTTTDCPEDVRLELAGQVEEVIDLMNFQD